MSAPPFEAAVWAVVARIPYGKVTTYGAIAWRLGLPRNARQVGWALRRAPEGLPCHRVVNASGRPAPGWGEQTALLAAEGVRFKDSGCVDLKACLWRDA